MKSWSLKLLIITQLWNCKYTSTVLLCPAVSNDLVTILMWFFDETIHIKLRKDEKVVSYISRWEYHGVFFTEFFTCFKAEKWHGQSVYLLTKLDLDFKSNNIIIVVLQNSTDSTFLSRTIDRGLFAHTSFQNMLVLW